MELNNRQLAILYGMLLGDACLQKTGRLNARLRLEHSLKQSALMQWKFRELEHIFQSEPVAIERMHPITKNVNGYVRLQSYAFPFLGELRRQFYNQEGTKNLPDDLEVILINPLTIAVWYMDDGYYDKRDKSAHIYLQAFPLNEIKRLMSFFEDQLGIECKAYCRPDRKACQLNFRNKGRDKLHELIRPHIIEGMMYKISNPVTTELKYPERNRRERVR